MGLRTAARLLACAAMALIMMTTGSSAAFSQAANQTAPAEHTATPRSEQSAVAEGRDSVSTTRASDSAPRQHEFKRLEQDFLLDQKRIWTSPARLRFSDAQWLVPVSGLAAGLFATDGAFSSHLSRNPKTISRYSNLSNAGVAALIGGGGGLWVLGHVRHDEHWSETGFLSGEAAVNSLLVIESLKYSLRRDRPSQGDGSGPFFRNGQSFPSEHSAAAWAIAGVIAHEYPGPLTKILAYGAASAIGFSRVRARQHFPSDVFIGGLIGNLVAQDIYTRHHDLQLAGATWRSMRDTFAFERHPSPENAGTVFVPIDSWVYPAFDRLIALGFVDTAFLGQRPWTRLECAHLLTSASDKLVESDSTSETGRDSIAVLQKEFSAELGVLAGGPGEKASVQSVYTRVTGISGQPLADGAHFGQTVVNDFGRPYQEGFNSVSGFSASATEGRYSIYVRGEFQHSPSAPAYSLPVRQVISTVDLNPLQPAVPVSEVNQFDLLETYVGVNLQNWEFTFGKQSLWWGPSYGGAFLFSNNADPIYMFRASRVVPFTLPWIFGKLGPAKIDLFFGKLSGNEFPPRPMLHGEKISFKPTPNLEFGFSRTSEFGGVGRPLTLGALFHSYFSFTSSVNYGASDNPGKRTSGFEFSYKIPYLRNWLTIYADSLAPDDPSPIDAPRRAALNPGFYLPRIPGLPKLDFRFEAVYTNTPADNPSFGNLGGQYIYWEQFYRDLYTNKRNLIGNWIGRDGQGFQSWSRYWFSPRNILEFGYRHAKVDGNFIPGGEAVNDGSVRLDAWVRRDLNVSAKVQYERWKAPVLAPSPQTNWTSSVGITFWPRSWSK